MNPVRQSTKDKIIPRKRHRHSYDVSVNEPAKLIENEPVEIETETPAEANEPVERIERENDSPSSAFKEE
jgi:hypothetical protein